MWITSRRPLLHTMRISQYCLPYPIGPSKACLNLVRFPPKLPGGHGLGVRKLRSGGLSIGCCKGLGPLIGVGPSPGSRSRPSASAPQVPKKAPLLPPLMLKKALLSKGLKAVPAPMGVKPAMPKVLPASRFQDAGGSKRRYGSMAFYQLLALRTFRTLRILRWRLGLWLGFWFRDTGRIVAPRHMNGDDGCGVGED